MGFWVRSRAKFPKMGDSLPWTPVNHVQNLTMPEKSVTVQKNKQTVNDISTLCLTAYVDNKYRYVFWKWNGP